jgi:hypothetical protein
MRVWPRQGREPRLAQHGRQALRNRRRSRSAIRSAKLSADSRPKGPACEKGHRISGFMRLESRTNLIPALISWRIPNLPIGRCGSRPGSKATGSRAWPIRQPISSSSILIGAGGAVGPCSWRPIFRTDASCPPGLRFSLASAVPSSISRPASGRPSGWRTSRISRTSCRRCRRRGSARCRSTGNRARLR